MTRPGKSGARLRESCLVWLRAAKATGDESDEWIDRIHALYTGDDYGTREPLLGHANLLLTEKQLRALADRFQAEMRVVLGERQVDERMPVRTYHLGAAIGLVADALRDPELRARSVLMYSPQLNSLQRASLAEACLEYDRPEVALAWLEGDWSGREYEQRRLLDRAYSALGDHEKLVEIRRQSFEATASRDSLRAWLEIVPEPEHVEAIQYARERVVQAEPTTAAESLLELGDVAAAAATIVERRTEVDGGSYSRLVSLAGVFAEQGKPLAATVAYRALLESILDRGQARAYAHGARYLQSLDRLTHSIEDYGPLPQHEAFMTALHARHGRKTSFWREVNALRQRRR